MKKNYLESCMDETVTFLQLIRLVTFLQLIKLDEIKCAYYWERNNHLQAEKKEKNNCVFLYKLFCHVERIYINFLNIGSRSRQNSV